MNRGKSGRAGHAVRSAAVALLLLAGVSFLRGPARAQTIVRLEVTADKAVIHLEPDGRSPVVETLFRGAIVRLSSALKFRTNWFYVLFVSSRSGRTLAGYVLDGFVRKLDSTLRVINLTPGEDEIVDPKEIDLTGEPMPKVEWGKTKAGILRAEGRPLTREVSGGLEFLSYSRDLLGKKCLLAYVLNDEKLVAIRLHLLEKYADKNRYIADYNKIRDFLNEKVGEPRYDNVVWRDLAHAEKAEDWGRALSSGGVSLSSEWVFSGTGLRLSLTGENNEILFAAEANDIKAKNPASF
ncbi:MAG: hypothetical protein NT006_03895 [Candidatus Aminicenantes bacterium]|nr:hypothetical protein [Candidatus Aminicenantes bacterium]